MSEENRVRTVRVVNDKDPNGGHMIVNESDYVKSQNSKTPMKLHRTEEQSDQAVSDRSGAGLNASGRNASGTYSEPTPSDVRYPDKDATEFENNHGAFIGGSAAEIRTDNDMADKPGGLRPEVHEKVVQATIVQREASTEAAAPASKDKKKKAKRRPAKRRAGKKTIDDSKKTAAGSDAKTDASVHE